MDKAAIFTAILRRNKLRRENGLPTIDVRAEYVHEVAVAKQRDYHARCDEHAADREIIRKQVLAELRAQHGPGFGHTMGGRWAVGELTRKRFAAWMAIQFGVTLEHDGPTKNTITYGESKRAKPTGD
jgi:hypothetical protein